MSWRNAGAHRWPAAVAVIILAVASTQVVARLESELRDAMQGFAASLATLVDASTREPLASTAPQRQAINGALAVIEEHAGLMAAHLERDDVAFIAAALEQQMQLLRFTARSGNEAAFKQVLDQSIGTCVDCHARTSKASGSRLATRLFSPEVEQRLPAVRRARLQVATRRFENARNTLESALPELRGVRLMDALEDYLSLVLRILPDPARALARVQAAEAANPDSDDRLAGWRRSLEYWIQHRGKVAELTRAHAALARARAAVDSDLGRVDFLVAVNEAERWLDRGIGSDTDAAEAYLIMGTGEHALLPTAWLPLPELYLEQAILLAPGSDTARQAVTIMGDVLQQRFAAHGLPVEVSDHLRALKAVAD